MIKLKNSKTIKNDARLALNGQYFNVLLMFVLSYFIMVILNAISIIISGPLIIGLDYYILNLTRNKNPKIDDLLYSFKTSLGTAVIASIFRTLIIFVFSLLLVIPGIIKAYAYFMTTFIIADEPNLSGMDALEKSKQMMEGHKMRLFKLHLSFIGWFILSLFTFGIGFIFLVPYVQTSNAIFYNDLRSTRQQIIDYDN